MWPDKVERFALLDEDVKSESLIEAEEKRRYAFLDLYRNFEDKILFLPCTPELGICNLLESDKQMPAALDKFAAWSGFDAGAVLRSDEYMSLDNNNPRRKAKKRISFLVEEAVRRVGLTETEVVRKLCMFYVENCGGKDKDVCKSIAGKIAGP